MLASFRFYITPGGYKNIAILLIVKQIVQSELRSMDHQNLDMP